MANAKRDWSAIEQEYVTSLVGLRELAERHKANLRVVGNQAKRRKWVEKRTQYNDEISTRAQQEVLKKAVDQRERNIMAINALVSRGLQRLAGVRAFDAQGNPIDAYDAAGNKITVPQMTVGARDLLEASKTSLVLLGETIERIETVNRDERTTDDAIRDAIQRALERRVAETLALREKETPPATE